jgi:putative peptidoglycan lipid II flippase
LFTLFLVLPAALGFFLLRFEIMEFLLGRNNAYADTILAGNLMGMYALGVIAIAFKEVADRGFYATKDSKTRAGFGLLIMAVNVGAVIALVPRFGAYAMPLAYGAAAAAGSAGLLIRLQLRSRFVTFRFLAEVLKTAVAAGVMFGAAWAFGRGLVLTAGIGVVTYFALAWVLGISAFRAALKGGGMK